MFNGLHVEFLEEILKGHKGLPTVGAVVGFISAVICSDSKETPQEYYGHIIGVTLEADDLDQFVTLLVELHNSIKAELANEAYEVPLDRKDNGALIIDGWVLGFNVGMALAPDYWKPKMESGDEDDTVSADLLAISLYASLIGEEHSGEEKVLYETCYEHITDDMEDIVLDLYELVTE